MLVASACYGLDRAQLPGDMYFAAGGDSSNGNLWNNGNNCGKKLRVQCQGKGCRGSGAITVKIVDRCANGCVGGGVGGRAFALSFQAFAAIADPAAGVITVKYSHVDDEDALAWAKEELIAEVGHGGN